MFFALTKQLFCWNEVWSLIPVLTNSLWNLALAYLLLGRFDPGWKYYEARFKACKEFEDLRLLPLGFRLNRLISCLEPASLS